MGDGTVVYSLVVGLWVVEQYVQSGNGTVGSRTVIFSLVVDMWVIEQ